MSLREMIGRSLDDGDIGPEEVDIIKKQMDSMKNGSYDMKQVVKEITEVDEEDDIDSKYEEKKSAHDQIQPRSPVSPANIKVASMSNISDYSKVSK